MVESTATRVDLRGQMFRAKRQMPEDQAQVFLRPGYPLMDQIILYEQKIEGMTGKQSFGLHH